MEGMLMSGQASAPGSPRVNVENPWAGSLNPARALGPSIAKAHQMVSRLVACAPRAEPAKPTIVNLDGDLHGETLRAIAQRESTRRLAALGGTAPVVEAVPRRRSTTP